MIEINRIPPPIPKPSLPKFGIFDFFKKRRHYKRGKEEAKFFKRTWRDIWNEYKIDREFTKHKEMMQIRREVQADHDRKRAKGMLVLAALSLTAVAITETMEKKDDSLST